MAKRPWYAVPKAIPLVLGVAATLLVALGFAGGWDGERFATAAFVAGVGFGLGLSTLALLLVGRDAPRPAKQAPEDGGGPPADRPAAP